MRTIERSQWSDSLLWHGRHLGKSPAQASLLGEGVVPHPVELLGAADEFFKFSHALLRWILAGRVLYPVLGLPGITFPAPGWTLTDRMGGTATPRVAAPPTLRLIPYPPPNEGLLKLVLFMGKRMSPHHGASQAK